MELGLQSGHLPNGWQSSHKSLEVGRDVACAQVVSIHDLLALDVLANAQASNLAAHAAVCREMTERRMRTTRAQAPGARLAGVMFWSDSDDESIRQTTH